MPSLLEQAGAARQQSSYAPLHTDRMFTGYFTNRSVLRDGASTEYQVRYGGGRIDAIYDGQNVELSPRLTLIRRPGLTPYNGNSYPPVISFYSFRQFTTTTDNITVLADTANAVYNVTQAANSITPVFNKKSGAGRAYFLGVGNTLYITDGKENVQWNPTAGTTFPWGIAPPTAKPSVSYPLFQVRGSWIGNTVFSRRDDYIKVVVYEEGFLHNCVKNGKTGAAPPSPWETRKFYSTIDGEVTWQNLGTGAWVGSFAQSGNDLVLAIATDGNPYIYQCTTIGTTSPTAPNFLPGLDSITIDNDVRWTNIGRPLHRADIGNLTPVLSMDTILDSAGNVQQVRLAGKSGPTVPGWNGAKYGYTPDPSGTTAGQIIWLNTGSTAAVRYGYAYMNSRTGDISNMSPASDPISTSDGQMMVVEGVGSTDTQVDRVIIYRTTHGGSTFLYAGQVANAPTWNFGDSVLDANLDAEWQAYVNGEGTPLPAEGCGPMAYHLGRIFVGVGNVVWVSSGPDAVAGTSSGNAGFDTFFTLQSKITRFWVTPIGLVVFTTNDSYVILGSGTDADPLYVTVWIPNLPLLVYDCFCEFMTAGYLYTGQRVVKKLDPAAGILDISFPVADQLEDSTKNFDPHNCCLTFHTEGSTENALYLYNRAGHWLRMSATASPEVGSNWHPPAVFAQGYSAVQSVEVDKGLYRLLVGPPQGGGAILLRDRTNPSDNGTAFPAYTVFGSITLCEPGQIAGLAFLTFETTIQGSRPLLSLLIGEIAGDFEPLKRTRQDPPLLPPSQSIRGDRFSLLQDQRPVWCRHFQFRLDWPAEKAFNELLTFTIFGTVRQERNGA